MVLPITSLSCRGRIRTINHLITTVQLDNLRELCLYQYLLSYYDSKMLKWMKLGLYKPTPYVNICLVRKKNRELLMAIHRTFDLDKSTAWSN